MINGAHVLLYSEKPELDRAFFKDVLGFPNVDVGHGWLIFALPPAEVAVHPSDAETQGQQHSGHRQIGAVLYLMCDDLAAQVAELRAKGISCTEVAEERWGRVTTIRLPSGSELGLYQPKHPVAYNLKKA
jgi:catechol 2,3-dioxygenase-like lactoylglutathione lyase family enzyme